MRGTSLRLTLPLVVFIAVVAYAQRLDSQKTLDTVIVHDNDVAVNEPSPNGGNGASIGYYFFGRRSKTPDFNGIFRKRVLHKGATIGVGAQDHDEVYYILSGSGVLNVNGTRQRVDAGTAILHRPGNTYGLEQTGTDDLVLIVAGP